jgi:phage shock protein A
MREPSPATEIRNLRRALAQTRDGAARAVSERDAFRARATKAEQEVAEWKRRFDLLLARTPEAPRE